MFESKKIGKRLYG